MRLRFAVAAALAAGTAVLAVGCASADLSSVAKAANKTEDAKTCAFSIRFDAAGETLTVEGAQDFAAKSGRMRALVDGEFTAESIWTPDGYFARVPGLGSDHKPWVQTSDVANLSQFSLFDPLRVFAVLREAGDFEESGSEEVRGVTTTHYAGRVDLAKFLETFPSTPEEDEPTERLVEESFRAEVWVDRDGRVRKVAYDLPNAGPGMPAGEMTFEFYDFGKPVDITPPPADQVMSMLDVPEATFTATLSAEPQTLTAEPQGG